MSLPMIIVGESFLNALINAGVIHRGDRVRRVVIDAQIGEAVVIHVERLGDTRVLDVAQTLTGIEITSHAIPEEG